MRAILGDKIRNMIGQHDRGMGPTEITQIEEGYL